jgi:hypothetical protein
MKLASSDVTRKDRAVAHTPLYQTSCTSYLVEYRETQDKIVIYQVTEFADEKPTHTFAAGSETLRTPESIEMLAQGGLIDENSILCKSTICFYFDAVLRTLSNNSANRVCKQ